MLLYVGCQQGFPKEPEVKKFYLVVFDKNKKPLCAEYDVLEYIPFTIGNGKFYDISKCDMIGGFIPEDVRKISLFMQEVKDWAKAREQQVK